MEAGDCGESMPPACAVAHEWGVGSAEVPLSVSIVAANPYAQVPLKSPK